VNESRLFLVVQLTVQQNKMRKTLHKPCPECLPLVLWRRLIVRIGLDLRNSGNEVHVLGRDGFAAEEEP